GRWLSYTYDGGGKLTQRTGDDGYALNYYYDGAGRLKRITDGSSIELVSYEYDSSGLLAKENKANGTYTTYSYDVAGHVVSIIHSDPSGATQAEFDYTYDTRGMRRSVTSSAGTTGYAYDSAGQLTGVNYPGGRTVQFVYDPSGNRA